ncbi:Disease resistance protein RPM1 [Acorus gramineus]|uniref:Disease resistance protein RPM1 n=1 Tax=Acorus gramineus TaxID=55184 RepID=A0AAV9BBG3_ACOGR|nr:Disease resistance protein RPM1 [Acorus gramineus]
MADAAVNLLIDMLKPIIEKEARLLGGVHGEVEKIQRELQSMTAFLKDADRRKDDDNDNNNDGDHGVKAWVSQVRDAAHEAQDVIEEYMFHLARRSRSGGGSRAIKFVLKSFRGNHLSTRHRIASRVQSIRSRVHEISSAAERYKFDREKQSTHREREPPRVAALFVDEADVVGIDAPREALLEWLTQGERRRVVVAVVAMAGMGKTTLVKKAFDHDMVKKSFDCVAWITVSQNFDMGEVLRSLIGDLFPQKKCLAPHNLGSMNDPQLVETLKAFLLNTSYLVVLDDVWNLGVWERMQYVFPDGENHRGRLVFTTRKLDVARACTEASGYVFELQPLRPEEAWELFCRRAFRREGGLCPDDLQDLSLNFVRRCGGLPLAIVAIGGLLAGKDKTMNEWDKVYRGLGWHLEMQHHLVEMKRIFLLSYNDLPYKHKSCFLYFSLFPEDCSIKCIKLVRLWIAEGFVENKHNVTLEEVANEYLDDLIKRSLIQVADVSSYGKVISCRIHDLVREVILSKARDENFTTFVGIDSGELYNMPRPRRLSVHQSFDLVSQESGFTHLRSLFTFGVTAAFTTYSLHRFFSGCRLLKVLDLDGMPIEKFPIEITYLLHLRYLSLRNTNISVIPESIRRLRNLETLDLKGTKVRKLPLEILKLRKLRHLLVYLYASYVYVSLDTIKGAKMPMKIGKLVELQKLSYLDLDGRPGQVKELKKLTQLKRLGILKLRNEDGRDLCDAIQKMKGLLSFSASSKDETELLDLHWVEEPPKLLQHLYLYGMLGDFPNWITKLMNLVKLRLRWSKLKNNPFESLQNLPNLAELELLEAYDGEELRCGGGGFKKLKVLEMDQLNELKVVEIGKGAMVSLQKLSIQRCDKLEKVPLGIEYVAYLKELHLLDMREEFIGRVCKYGGEDHSRVEHIQIIDTFYQRDGQFFHEVLK